MSANRPSVAIVNVWSDQNRGDAAIVEATIEAVKEVHGCATIHLHNCVFGYEDLLSQLDKHFSFFLQSGLPIYPSLCPTMTVVDKEPTIRRWNKVLYLFRALSILLLASIKPRFGKLLLKNEEMGAYRSLCSADLIVSKGGSYLLGNHWKDFLTISMVMFPLVLGSICGARTMMLGVSIGPANSPWAARVMRFWFRWVNCFVLREEKAYETCIRLGVSPSSLFVMPDLAFLPIVRETVAPRKPDILEGVQGPLVGVTVREWGFDDVRERQGRQRNYIESVAFALNSFVLETGAKVVLIPQVIGPSPAGSDVPALVLLESMLANKESGLRMPNDLTPKDLRAIYSHLDLLVGTRLHSIILAFGTPCVIVGYQGDKSQGTAALIKSEDQFIHINDITGEELLRLMRLAWTNSADIKMKMSMLRPHFRELFESKLPQVLALLDKKRTHV